MDNKRKIEILNQVINKCNEYIKREWFATAQGICDMVVFDFMNKEEQTVYRSIEISKTKYISELLHITMPPAVDECGYCWEKTKQGYQARIKACKQAIKELSK